MGASITTNDWTNKALSKLFSGEMIVIVVLAGIAWGALNSDVKAQKEDIEEVKEEQSAVKTALSGMAVQLGKVETRLENMEDKQQAFQESQNITQQEILHLLKSQNSHNSNGDHNGN